LAKILQLRQTLEAAQQQELQYKSQMEVLSINAFYLYMLFSCCYISINLDSKSPNEHSTNAAAFRTSSNARKHFKIPA
jgi:hypothetical protein